MISCVHLYAEMCTQSVHIHWQVAQLVTVIRTASCKLTVGSNSGKWYVLCVNMRVFVVVIR